MFLLAISPVAGPRRRLGRPEWARRARCHDPDV